MVIKEKRNLVRIKAGNGSNGQMAFHQFYYSRKQVWLKNLWGPLQNENVESFSKIILNFKMATTVIGPF